MRKVERSEIVDYQTYADDIRPAFRKVVLAQKAVRRFHVGEVLTFLFDNHDTIRYQILEMMRVERIVKASAIQHEIDTYNGLLGGDGEFGCTLLVEITEPALRAEKLARWGALNKALYVELEDGSRVPATWDETQVDEKKLSSVQYLKFDTKGAVPVAIGCAFDDPMVFGRTAFTDAQREALAADLAEG